MVRSRYVTLADTSQLEAAARELSERCHVMRAIFEQTGLPPLRDFTADFAGLARIVTGQQLSAASAAAIWGRVAARIVPFDAATVLAITDAELAQLGLSGGKIRTLKAMASAIRDDGFDIAALRTAPDAVVIERLTSLHGIGPWTADIYLLFALRRADAFAAGDLALQLAAQRLFNLKSRPTALELAAISERWRPWRGVAARLLWADYAVPRTKVIALASKRGRTALK